MNEQSTFTARVACERCGNVRIEGAELTLRVAHHDGSAEVRFACPDCGRTQLQTVDEHQAAALVTADVTIEWWQLPPDLNEPHAASSLRETEIDAFVAFLSDDVALRLAVGQLATAEQHETGHAS